MSELRKILTLSFLILSSFFSYGQGPSLSPYDLKESYLEKRESYQNTSTKKITTDKQAELDGIVTLLEENAPNSYEYHLVKYINGNYDLSLKENLFEAYRLKPDALEVRREMFAYYTLLGNEKKQGDFARLLLNTYSKNTQTYYVALSENQGIHTLFLSGKGDAFPALILQSVGQIRSDINLVSLDFLKNDNYRRGVQNKLGMSDVDFNVNEASFIPTALSVLAEKGFIATTLSQRYFRESAQGCYLTGLHYQFQCPNQREQLDSFWLTSQSVLLGLKLESRYEKSLFGNYLPPLLTLYQLKLLEKEKDTVLRKAIVLLAEKLGKETAVSEILKAYEQSE